ncbi:MAG TPA: Ig-like domain-containing protein [Gemmatimonadales bacterium]|nr:Ig-like domain-containing protein [Gemmatimonadales bacterium]
MSPSPPPAALALLLVTACANIQPPPGGPPDTAPPVLVATFPESLDVGPRFGGAVEFRFDEVVSEGSNPSLGLGTGDLEKLVIVSPTERVADVEWHRRRITVKPAEGWKPGRVYRVELLPGVADVRRNQSKAEAVVTLSTGAPPPLDTLRGTVVDWKGGRPSPGALVEAVLQPDSLPYRGLADSSGRFTLGPLPKGQYVVFGVLDQNHNLRRDPREAFDSVRLGPDSTDAGSIYAFVHDTLPPRIQGIQASDSVTAAITFTQSLDPYQKLDTSNVAVYRSPDSTRLPVIAVLRADTARPAPPVTGQPGAAPPGGVPPGAGQAPAPGAPGARPAAPARPRVQPGAAGRGAAPADTARAPRADTARAPRVAPSADTTRVPRAAPQPPGKPAPTPARPAPAKPAPAPARPGAAPAADTLRGARPESTAVREAPPGPPTLGRPPLSDKITFKVADAWRPGDKFSVEVTGVRTVSGVTGDARGAFAIPEPKATGRPGAPGDSLRPGAPPDTGGVRPSAAPSDSTRADSAHADSARARPPR